MDDNFDLLVKEHLKKALEAAYNQHNLKTLNLKRFGMRQRFQLKLGAWLISIGTRLREDVASPAGVQSFSRSRA